MWRFLLSCSVLLSCGSALADEDTQVASAETPAPNSSHDLANDAVKRLIKASKRSRVNISMILTLMSTQKERSSRGVTNL